MGVARKCNVQHPACLACTEVTYTSFVLNLLKVLFNQSSKNNVDKQSYLKRTAEKTTVSPS